MRLRVKSDDPTLNSRRETIARRVISEFGERLPERLLIFLDDVDWPDWKDEQPANRGFHVILPWVGIDQGPTYLGDFVAEDAESSYGVLTEFVYLHGSTCLFDIGLTMTLAHELQHVIQQTHNRTAMAASRLIREFVDETNNDVKFQWSDIPNEREARIVQKRVAVTFYDDKAISAFIDARIANAVNAADAEDWRFVQGLDPTLPYDLTQHTIEVFKRLREYRPALRALLPRITARPEFAGVDLSEFFED